MFKKNYVGKEKNVILRQWRLIAWRGMEKYEILIKILKKNWVIEEWLKSVANLLRVVSYSIILFI